METKQIKKIKVGNMVSPKTRRTVSNQFVITTPEGKYFQSYETTIAYIPRDYDAYPDENTADSQKIQLDPAWKFSRTTSKYRRMFLDETTKETQQKIESGEYLIKNLN